MVVLVTRRSAIVEAVASATVVTLTPITSFADQPTLHEVKIQRFKFVPDTIHVQLGDGRSPGPKSQALLQRTLQARSEMN
ncbi:hypothetical protein C1J03_07555 [Sulfitobacter sp. SK012]|nr:hypothetical protein C1J03_07555 [Sulfitobacter sp. SK012]